MNKARWSRLTSRARSLWAWLVREGENLKPAGVILAAAWALFLYLDHRHEARVAETMKYVERYGREDIAKLREELDGHWISIAGVGVLFASSDVEVRTAAVTRIIDDKLGTELRGMLDFYSQMALCARKGLCELSTSCAFFEADVHNFNQMYFPLIELWALAHRADLLGEVRGFRTDCRSDNFFRRARRFLF